MNEPHASACAVLSFRNRSGGAEGNIDAGCRVGYRDWAVRQLSPTYLFSTRRDAEENRHVWLRALRAAIVLLPGLFFCQLLVCVIGCSARTSTFEIVDYRESGQPKRYRETFNEAYYDVDPHGNVEIVFRRSEPSEADPDREITQVVHIRSVWRSIPGWTVAHSTQINGTVGYLILTGRVGATFEGAGSVFFNENHRKNRLKGTLDLALLRPTRRLAGGNPIFERAELKGKFRAKRDRRRLVRLVNDMNRLFGPLPQYQPPAPGPS